MIDIIIFIGGAYLASAIVMATLIVGNRIVPQYPYAMTFIPLFNTFCAVVGIIYAIFHIIKFKGQAWTKLK